MRRERNIGYVAAIGGTAAAIMLVTGICAARADELSDLRAKEQQLQQQLDQLQGAAPTAPGGGGSGGTATPHRPPVVGGSFPRSFLIPGTDTSVSISGSVQTNFSFGNSR
jgi:hypothetical protein